LERGPNAIARFADLCVREADEIERRQAARQMDFDCDQGRVEPCETA
jgi:hypothetical protein